MYYTDPGVSPHAFVRNDPLNRYDARGLVDGHIEYRWESWRTWFNRNSSNYWTAENGGGGPIGPTTWATAGGKNAAGGYWHVWGWVKMDDSRYLSKEDDISYPDENISGTAWVPQWEWIGFGKWESDDENILKHNLTFKEAKIIYQYGNGMRVDVPLSEIDLSNVSIKDFDDRGLVTVKLDTKHFSNINDALVHGTITLRRMGNSNKVKIAINSTPGSPVRGQPAGMLNFEMKSWGNSDNWLRNMATFLGWLIYGSNLIQNMGSPMFYYSGGTPFPIYYHGTATINWR